MVVAQTQSVPFAITPRSLSITRPFLTLQMSESSHVENQEWPVVMTTMKKCSERIGQKRVIGSNESGIEFGVGCCGGRLLLLGGGWWDWWRGENIVT